MCFKNIIKYIRGITYKKTDEISNNDTDLKNGLADLRANNINFDFNTLNWNIKRPDKYRSLYLRENDILICAGSGIKNHLGKIVFIEKI